MKLTRISYHAYVRMGGLRRYSKRLLHLRGARSYTYWVQS